MEFMPEILCEKFGKHFRILFLLLRFGGLNQQLSPAARGLKLFFALFATKILEIYTLIFK